MKILITGGTGFIGRRLSKKLITEGHELLLIVRGKSKAKAESIFKGIKIEIIEGDITELNASSFLKGIQNHFETIESVIHLAAIYDLEVPLHDAHNTNVLGTQNVLELTKMMPNLKSFHHVSTYAVNGGVPKKVNEGELIRDLAFPDFYSQTKNEAEQFVQNFKFKEDVKLRIYRPCIIVGDSKNGEIEKVDGPYYFFKLFKNIGKVNKLIPMKGIPLYCHKESELPIMPVDTLVNWLSFMLQNMSSHKKRTYHLMPTDKILITQFVEKTLLILGVKTKVIRLMLPGLFKKILPILGIPKELVPYMSNRTSYDIKNFKEDFPNLETPKLDSYLKIIIEASKV